MRKKSKYKPKDINSNVFLTAFLCDHDSFITIDNLMHRIKHLCALDYKQGVGYVMNDELGKEIVIIENLQNWINEWRVIASDANVKNYSDVALNSIIKKLNFKLDISDELLAQAEREIDLQRAIYRTLAKNEKGKSIMRNAIQARLTTEAIKSYLVAA